MRGNQFPNDIERIILFYRFKRPFNRIRICFDISGHWSKIEINIDSKDAREIVTGITLEFERILKDHTNLNSIFSGEYQMFVSAICVSTSFFFIVSVFTLETKISQNQFQILVMCFLFALVACGIWKILSKFNPYTIFDTKKNEKAQKGIRWVLKGLFAAILFGGSAKIIFNQITMLNQ